MTGISKTILILLLFFTINTVSAEENVSIIDDTDFGTSSVFITTLAGQNSTNITISETLEFYINNAPIQFTASANATLSNITYSSDILNSTASASTGILNISVKMLNNSRLYYLYIDGIKNASTTSNTSGWVSFSWSNWSQHNFSIQADTTPPTLTSDSVSPTSIQQGYSTAITALFLDDTSVSLAIVKVEQPDGSSANWSMTCTGEASVTCTKTYNSTVILGTYYIRYYYPQDDSGNTANISSTKTFEVVPVTTSSSGGGGGGGIYDDQNNPPGIQIKIIELNPPNANLLIEIINEGRNKQEYVYSWTLEKQNIVGLVFGFIDKWQASKLVQVGEKVSIPVIFSNLKDGKYTLKVDVDYGKYTSKAQVVFDIGAPKKPVITQAKDMVLSWKYYIAVIAVLIALLAIITRTPMKRIIRPPMQPNR